MAAEHPLTPLLSPASVALVGASPRQGTPGNGIVVALREAGYAGAVYPVNPKYDDIEGIRAWPSVAALPEAVDCALLCVGARHLDGVLADAIGAGARSAVIFDSCHVEGDANPNLVARLAARARAAGIPVCGGNCMGFYNLDARAYLCGYPGAAHIARGPVALITHSGTNFGSLAQADRRLRFNLVISSGQEMVTTMADYMDYALAQPTTRVLALFLETVREPAKFTAALERAVEQDVPVVALKVGRNETSARMAQTHSGALAGNDAAYQALFARYGVIRVHDQQEMAATLTLLSGPRRAGPGGLAAIGDSGGERGMMVDLADDLDVPFAAISGHTSARLAARLAPGLEPVNPTDAWGTMDDFRGVFRDGLVALVEDPDTAIGILLRDIRTGEFLSESLAEVVVEVAGRVNKPVALATNYSGIRHGDLALRLAEAGVPVLDGTRQMLQAVRHAFDYRDFRARPREAPPPGPAPEVRRRWGARLAAGGTLDEAEGLALLADYGLSVPRHRVVASAAAAVAASEEIGLPVAMKTAEAGILHKSDVGGVVLGIDGPDAARAAYDDLARRLGPRVLVAAMAGEGVELALGMVSDPQFGPLVMLGAGGVWIELLDDRRFALPPFGPATARRLIDGLRLRPLLDGRRGRPAADVGALAAAVARFSVLAAELGPQLEELDVNPLLAGPAGCLALDALAIPRAAAPTEG